MLIQYEYNVYVRMEIMVLETPLLVKETQKTLKEYIE